MYLTAETQTRVLRRFHFALRPDGFLFLGKAEMLLGHGAVFTPVDGKRRVFRKTPGLLLAEAVTRQAAGADSYRLEGVEALREETILAAPMPVVVVTDEGRLALASRAAEVLFGISQRDLGRAFRDLDLSYRPVELHQHIDQARRERRTVRIKDVEWLRGTNMVHLEIQITPLIDRSSTCLGTSIVFQDTSQSRRLRQDLELANRHLETAYEELQSTNEELETTNEELQSTVEELETTNEELQSTNEQLETMNEELQSTNDELQTINEELRERTEELNELNDFLESVLTGLRAGFAVLDRELRVQVWNRPADDLWGLRNGEAVGREFLSLEIGLPLDELTVPLRRAVGSGEGFELYVPSVNRFGKAVNVRVVGGPLPRGDGDNRGAIVVMDVVDHVKPAGATQASPS